MAKSNFFVTAAALNLGLLSLSALSYWFTKNNSQEEKTSEEDSSTQNSCSQENLGHPANDDANPICIMCQKKIASTAITFSCGHSVHVDGDCLNQVVTNGLAGITEIKKCPRCDKVINIK